MAKKGYTVGVLITGDGSGAQKAMKLTEEQLEALNKKIKNQGTDWEAWSKKAAAGAASFAASIAKAGVAAGVAGTAIAAVMVKSAIDSADATGILAGKLGITTEALSKLQYAAKLSDVSQGALESGMKKLARTLTDAAAGAGGGAKAFEALGLSAEQIIKLPADKQLGAIADALNRVENSSQKAALAQQIFGRGGVELLPLIAEGSAGIAKMGGELERLGGVISGSMAARAMQLNDNIDRLKTATMGFGFALAEQALPKLEQFSNQIVALAQDREAMQGVAEAITGIGTAAKYAAMIVVGFGQDLNDLFTRNLEEVQAELVATSRELEAARDHWGIFTNKELVKRLEERVAALTAEREALRQQSVQVQGLIDLQPIVVTARKKSIAAIISETDVTRALAGATQTLTQAEKDRREDEMFSIMQKREADLGLYENKAAIEATTGAIAAQIAESDPWAEAMVHAVERVDESFASAWLNVGDGFDGLLDGMKGALEQWLAEMAHILVTKPLMANISAGITGGGGGGAGGVGGIGGLFSAAKTGYGWLTGAGGTGFGIGTSLGNVYGGLEDALGALGIKTPGESFRYAGATGLESVGRLGLNVGAGMAGSYLASSLYGGRESTGYGSMAGGFVGSAFGPVGTFVGAAVGEAVDRALSGSDFSGKRVKLGIGTGSMVDGGDDWENARTLSSGLRVANLTRRVGEAGMSDEDAQAYLNAFDTLDSALTSMARAAGVAVDLSGQALPGMSQSYDGGTSGGAFFGSLAKGELRDLMQDAPAEFARQWVEALGDELPVRVREIMGDTAGATAEELLSAFGSALDLDRLLNIDVIRESAKAAEEASKTILDAYNTATDSVVTLAHEYDGSTASLQNLTGALAAQKEVAAALAMQYQELSASVDALFGDSITQIRESLMSEDELYASRRDQIAALMDQLEVTTDPAALASLVAQIDALAKQAWGMLSPEEQRAVGTEYIAFLEDAREQAQQQIDEGQKLLAEREQALVNAVDLDVVKTSIAQQAEAANTLKGAADTFGAWVAALPSVITVVGPPITVNVASPSEVNI